MLLCIGILCLFAADPPARGGQPVTGSGQTAEAATGADFSIRLPANPTTGYSWRIQEISGGEVVRFISSAYEGPESDRVGAGGVEVWTFQAMRAGEARIEFLYVRPWEKKAAPADRTTVKVRVR
jgi:inhibitor of cysteine peptidase